MAERIELPFGTVRGLGSRSAILNGCAVHIGATGQICLNDCSWQLLVGLPPWLVMHPFPNYFGQYCYHHC